MKDKPLTTAEAADFLSVNEWTVRHYIRQGLIKAHKMGNGTGKKGNKRGWRIWREDLVKFLDSSSNISEV